MPDPSAEAPPTPDDRPDARPAAGALIDEFLPHYDVREHHRLRIAAPPEVAYRALLGADLGEALLVRVLLALRALPGALSGGTTALRTLHRRGHEPINLETFEAHGFRRLAERPPMELVIGLEGHFWRPTGNLRTPTPASFRSTPPAPGCARGVWNFSVRAMPDHTSEFSTETRVLCADDTARRRFLPYWHLIRPASGLIRRSMLQTVRRLAEQEP